MGVKAGRSSPDDSSHQRALPWAGPYLLVAALVVPLVYSNRTIDPVLLPRFLLVSLLGAVLAGGCGLRLIRRRAALVLGRAEALVVGLLVLCVVVSAITLSIAGPTPDGIFDLLKMATLVWLVHASSRAIGGNRPMLVVLAKLVLVAVFFVGTLAVLQLYQVPIFEWMKSDTTVDSTMGHRNLLASFLLLALPFVAYLFLELNGPWRLASAMVMLIVAFLVGALQTRSVWVAFPAGLGFSVLGLVAATRRAPLSRHSGAYRQRSIQGVALVALAVGIALLVDSPGSRAPVREHAGALVRLSGASIQERLQLWSRTISMIRDHPLTGVGPGNWRVAVPAYGMGGTRADTGTLHFQRPHNDFLWVASETGLLGGMAYVAVFASILAVAVRGLLRSRCAHDRAVITLALFGVSCYAIDALFSFPKERIVHAVYLALLVGTLLSFQRGDGTSPATWSFSRRWSIAIVVLVWVTTLFGCRFALSRYRAEVHLRNALAARAAKDWPRMVAYLDHIEERDYALDPSAAPVAWYRGVARFESGDRPGALADFRRALAVHPNHVHVLNNLATCHTLNGEYAEAIRLYERAIVIAPRFEEARVNLGFVLHSLGRDAQALEVLAPLAGDAKSPRFEECWRSVRAALGLTS